MYLTLSGLEPRTVVIITQLSELAWSVLSLTLNLSALLITVFYILKEGIDHIDISSCFGHNCPCSVENNNLSGWHIYSVSLAIRRDFIQSVKIVVSFQILLLFARSCYYEPGVFCNRAGRFSSLTTHKKHI